MNKECSIWECSKHGIFRTRQAKAKCPICKSVKVHFIEREKKIEEEFNLSEKREELLEYLKEQFGDKSLIPNDILRMVIGQDKEFIRLSQKKGHFVCGKKMIYIEDLLKLAGKKLR